MISTRHLLDYASGPREAAALRQEYGATLHDLITVILADWLEQHGEDEHSEADTAGELAQLAYEAVLSGSPEARQAAVAAAASAYADSLSPAQRSALSAEHARQDLAGHPAPQAFRPGVAVNTMLIIASVPITLGVALGAAFGWTRLGGRES